MGIWSSDVASKKLSPGQRAVERVLLNGISQTTYCRSRRVGRSRCSAAACSRWSWPSRTPDSGTDCQLSACSGTVPRSRAHLHRTNRKSSISDFTAGTHSPWALPVVIVQQNLDGISGVVPVTLYRRLGIHKTRHTAIMWKHDVIRKTGSA